MTIAKYCKQKGMTKEQYFTFLNNIQNTAKAITQNTQKTRGMYYPINDIINYNSNNEMKMIIIHELKKHGFEFIENYTLYRY